MKPSPTALVERVEELLIKRAVTGLTDDETAELRGCNAEADASFDLAVAALDLATLSREPNASRSRGEAARGGAATAHRSCAHAQAGTDSTTAFCRVFWLACGSRAPPSSWGGVVVSAAAAAEADRLCSRDSKHVDATEFGRGAIKVPG